MKSKLKFIVFFLFIAIKMQAQTAIPAGTFTVNGKTFNATIDTRVFVTDGSRMSPNTMHIVLTNGEIMTPAAKVVIAAAGHTATRECLMSVYNYDIEYRKTDFVRFFNIMRSVFPANRLTDIMNYDNVGVDNITFYIDPSGVAKDVMITISENTLITPQEIELLYTRMLAQMSFYTLPSGCPSAMRFIKSANVRTQRDLYTDPYYFGNGPVWDNR